MSGIIGYINNAEKYSSTLLLVDNDLLDIYLKMPFSLRSDSKIWIRALAKLNFKIAVLPDANTEYSPFIPKFLEQGINIVMSIARKHFLKPQQLPHPTYTQDSWPNYAELIR